jgi:hypothetical protein
MVAVVLVEVEHLEDVVEVHQEFKEQMELVEAEVQGLVHVLLG